jgi:pimeloyl-ACP methyl ester carboxylesterase
MDVRYQDSSGNEVQGILSIPDSASVIVIMSHGYSSSKDSSFYKKMEKELNGRGIGTLRYDYYGHGPGYGHTGPGYAASKDVTLSKCVESLKASVKYVRERGDYDIVLLGASFGGLISFLVAAEDSQIKALALKSPVTEPMRLWGDRLKKRDFGIEGWKKKGIYHFKDRLEDYWLEYGFWEDLQNYDTLKSARKISCPTLIVHGDSDTYVPIEQSQELANILRTEVKVVKGADHDFEGQIEEVKKLMVDFLVENLKK